MCSDGSLQEWRGGGGVYIASTQNPTVTHIIEQSRWDRSGQLGETESSNNVNVGVFGGTENTISVIPIWAETGTCQFRWDRLHHLGDTDLMTEGYRTLATHVSVRPSSESENPSLLGFGLWLRWFISVWLSLDNRWDRDYLWVCIVVKVADSWRRYITKHLSNQIINTTSSPFNSIGFSYGLNVIFDH